jgi:hypothetical protein
MLPEYFMIGIKGEIMRFVGKALSWNSVESSHRLMALIVLTFGLFNFFWGEKVPAGEGLGWDGLVYADMVRNLGTLISDAKLGSYYAQRILPSSAVHVLLALVGAPLTTPNIIRGFEVYNLFLLVGATWVWKRISDDQSLSLTGRWIGFGGLFFNYQSTKHLAYGPVVTDATALSLALLLLMFYLERKPLQLFAAAVIGAFVWPVASICGAFMLLFLHTNLPEQAIEPALVQDEKNARWYFFIKLAGFTFIALSILAYLVLSKGNPDSQHFCKIPASWTDTIKFIAVPCTLEGIVTGLPPLLWMLAALVMLIGSKSFLVAILSSFKKIPLKLVALPLAAVLLPAVIVRMLSNPEIANPSSIHVLMEFIFLPPRGKFFLSYLALVILWGPLMLLILLRWKAFCIQARRLGPAIVAIIAFSLPLGLAAEARFVTIAWPCCVLVLVRVLEDMKLNESFKWTLLALTVVYSQFWMKINLSPWTGSDTAGLLEFPKQMLFMHYGLWMNWTSYLVQLTILFFSAIWLSKTIKPNY